MIPEKPLEIALDVNNLTLEEACLFSPNGFDFVAFRNFMVAHSNWTRAEVNSLLVGELQEVAVQVGEAVKSIAVPKAKPPHSRRGRG